MPRQQAQTEPGREIGTGEGSRCGKPEIAAPGANESGDIVRVFPRRTKWTPADGLAFVGDPPLFLPRPRMVMVSVTFSWDMDEGQRLQRAWGQHFENVQLGGPAFGDPGGEFTPGRFVMPGVTITSRGCPNRCPWCLVPGREGHIREYPIRDGWIIQDNNLLACSKEHQAAVFDMLRRQPRAANFKGGFEAQRITPWHVDHLRDMRLQEIWLACDSRAGLRSLEGAANLLHGISTNKKRCFVMIGFDPKEGVEDAAQRLERVLELGFLPFCQLYQPAAERKLYPQEWRDLARKWSRPAAYRARKAA